MLGFLVYETVELERNRWYVQKCITGAAQRGHRLELKIAENFSLGIQNSRPALWYEGAPCNLPDFVIMRGHDWRLSRQFEDLGVKCFNNSTVCRICNDKAATHAYLATKGVPMLDTVFVSRAFPVQKAPFLPAVVKTAGGHGGKQVFWVDAQPQYERVCADIVGDYIVQRPAGTLGKDLRVYILGNQILAAVLRTGQGDFRSNFSLGGRVEAYTLTPEQQALVENILRHFDFDLAGLDFVFDGEKMYLNEIEDVVGSRMLYQTTDLDAAELYLDHIFKKC